MNEKEVLELLDEIFSGSYITVNKKDDYDSFYDDRAIDYDDVQNNIRKRLKKYEATDTL